MMDRSELMDRAKKVFLHCGDPGHHSNQYNLIWFLLREREYFFEWAMLEGVYLL